MVENSRLFLLFIVPCDLSRNISANVSLMFQCMQCRTGFSRVVQLLLDYGCDLLLMRSVLQSSFRQEMSEVNALFGEC